MNHDPLKRSFSCSLLATVLLCTPLWGAAQTPAAQARPITMVVPFTAGSGTDVIARIISDPLSKQLGQSIVIDNRAGAGGTLGAALVAAAPPNGQMLLVHSAGHVANAALYPRLKYDTLKDLAPVSLLAELPNVLVVSPASKITKLDELVRKARANPGTMNYASAGNGSATHINAEKFRLAAKLQASHVPYRGTPPALVDVAGGQVDWFFAPLVSALPLINDGRLVPVAVGSKHRSPALPAVPTTVEAGFPNSDYTFWVGAFLPARTPADVTERYASAFAKVLSMPEVRSALERLSAEPGSLTRKQFGDLVAQDFQSTTELIRQLGITAD